MARVELASVNGGATGRRGVRSQKLPAYSNQEIAIGDDKLGREVMRDVKVHSCPT